MIPGLGASSGEGNVYPFQYSCLGNSMDRGAWCATGYGVAKELDMTERLSTQACSVLGIPKGELTCLLALRVLVLLLAT